MRWYLVLAFALATSCGTLQALGPQELQRFTLLNETGHEIRYLFVSSSDTRQWGPDLLGDQSLTYGIAKSWLLHFAGDAARFDLLAFDSTGAAYRADGLMFEKGKDVFLTLGPGNFSSRSLKLSIIRIRLTNASDKTVAYMFFAPAESENWGFDVLGDDRSMFPGQTLGFSLPASIQSSKYDILALTRDRLYLQRAITVSAASPELTLEFTNGDIR